MCVPRALTAPSLERPTAFSGRQTDGQLLRLLSTGLLLSDGLVDGWDPGGRPSRRGQRARRRKKKMLGAHESQRTTGENAGVGIGGGWIGPSKRGAVTGGVGEREGDGCDAMQMQRDR